MEDIRTICCVIKHGINICIGHWFTSTELMVVRSEQEVKSVEL